MIRIAFSSSLLIPAISIEDTTDSPVASGTMVFDSSEENGMSWYTFNFSGTPGSEYHIRIDAGDTIIDPEIRYIDEWVVEEIIPLADADYIAPDNASITAIKSKTDLMQFTDGKLHTIAKTVEDKTGYSITTIQIDAIIEAIEGALLNEGDGTTFLATLIAGIRADIERNGGMLATRATASDVSIQLTSSPNASVPISIIV